MSRLWPHRRSRSATALLALAIAACGSDTAAPIDLPSITVAPAVVELDIGQSVRLVATVRSVPDPAVGWTSLSPDVVTVDDGGQLTAVGPGSAVVVATVLAHPLVTATVDVAVRAVPAGAAINLAVLGLGPVPERFTGEVAARGAWAYTSTWSNRNGIPGNAIKIWNVAGNVPVLTDSLIVPLAATTGDVQISADGALLVVATEHSPGSIVIYDRTNPARPELLAQFTNANTNRGVHTVKLGRVNGRHYAFLSVNPSPPRLVIVDITDPRAPFEVLSQTMGRPFIPDTFVRDGLLFAALWHDGLRIFDIGGGGRGGSPAAPVVLGDVLTATGSIHNIWWFHDPHTGSKQYVFLGEEGPGSVGGGTSSGDIHVIDVSDMTNPRVVAQFNVPGAGAHNFWMDEPSGILYAAYYNGGVRALDVRGDLGSCTAEQRWPSGLCDLRRMGREVGVSMPAGAHIWGVVHQDTHVYASDMRLGLFKIDASALRR
jgi:hypothetical protein